MFVQHVLPISSMNSSLWWYFVMNAVEQLLTFRVSVHHSTIHKEKSNKMQLCIKLCYSIFIWSSTCFGRHTAHHQEPKTALLASGFSYVEGCWTCSWWTLSGTYCAWQRSPTTRPTTFHVCKTRGCQCSFRLLMMGGVSPETCWASYKYGVIKKLIHCCILLDFSLWIEKRFFIWA